MYTRASLTPNGISIGSAVFAGLMVVTNRERHAHRHTVAIARIYAVAACDAVRLIILQRFTAERLTLSEMYLSSQTILDTVDSRPMMF